MSRGDKRISCKVRPQIGISAETMAVYAAARVLSLLARWATRRLSHRMEDLKKTNTDYDLTDELSKDYSSRKAEN